MTHDELAILNRLGRSGRDILEVGSWAGRSTCSIAAGIRDNNRRDTTFDVVDYGITGADDFKRRFGFDPDIKDPQFAVVDEPGGVAGALMQNLASRGLLPFVTMVILGDLARFDSSRRYGAIFADVLHDQAEIDRNMPLIAAKLAADFVFIADDMVDDRTATLVAKHLGVTEWWLSQPVFRYTKLGVFWSKSAAADAAKIIGTVTPAG